MNEIPKIYLTHDMNGIFMWFSTGSPKMIRKTFVHKYAASKTRLPESWFKKVIPMGKCLEYDVFELFTKKMKSA